MKRSLMVFGIGLMLASCGGRPIASGPSTTSGPHPPSQPSSPYDLPASHITEATVIVPSGSNPQPSPVPLCAPAAVKQSVTVAKKDLTRGRTRIVFTTTFQNTGSIPCGMGELQTCTWPGVILTNAAGNIIWHWNIPKLSRVCDPRVAYVLPVSISTPEWTFTPSSLPHGSYTVSTDQSIVDFPPATTTFQVP